MLALIQVTQLSNCVLCLQKCFRLKFYVQLVGYHNQGKKYLLLHKQDILGKYLFERMTRPPRNASFSTRITGQPTSAASTAAVIPAIPPPMTRIGFGSELMAHSGDKGWDTSKNSLALKG